MRIAVLVLISYVVLLVAGPIWHALGTDWVRPDFVALFAIYFGLTARDDLTQSLLGAFVTGYLGDLLAASPTKGIYTFCAVAICISGHFLHSQLLLHGVRRTFLLGWLTGVVGSLALVIARLIGEYHFAPLGQELGMAIVNSIATGFAGFGVFYICRSVDLRFSSAKNLKLGSG